MLIPPAKSKKVKNNFPFSFFSKVLFNFFGILKNAKDEKSNMLWKRRKVK
jgi:hypothetical protein